MPTFSDWFPVALTGTTMTVFGLIKLYGLARGIVSGRCQPMAERLCGACARPHVRGLRIVLPVLLLAVGLGELVWLWWMFYVRGEPG
jgi:hypothetical protein